MTRSSSNNRGRKKGSAEEYREKLLETTHLGKLYKGKEMEDVEIHRRCHIENSRIKKKIKEE